MKSNNKSSLGGRRHGGVAVQTKTSRLIFPFDKSTVGIFPYLNIYSPAAFACAGVMFFRDGRVHTKVTPG